MKLFIAFILLSLMSSCGTEHEIIDMTGDTEQEVSSKKDENKKPDTSSQNSSEKLYTIFTESRTFLSDGQSGLHYRMRLSVGSKNVDFYFPFPSCIQIKKSDFEKMAIEIHNLQPPNPQAVVISCSNQEKTCWPLMYTEYYTLMIHLKISGDWESQFKTIINPLKDTSTCKKVVFKS